MSVSVQYYFLSIELTVEGEQYLEYTDGVATWRKGVRNGGYVLDKALTPTGFNGSENIDWVNVISM